MSPYRTDLMTPEEEVDYLRRLLASAEARLAASRGKSEPVAKSEGLDAILADWRSFWSELGLELDVSTLRIPERQEGLNRLLVMPKGATSNFLYEACSKLFPCWRYTENLDDATSVRDPANGAYAIWVRDAVEADEELKGKSANDLAQARIKSITLPERLALELKYFKETGKHLDIKNITLCSGSRDPDGGGVPGVDWRAEVGGMSVYWYSPDSRGGRLRARAAVSL